MNINDMLNKSPRFTPIKNLMGDLPHDLSIPIKSFNEETKSNIDQQNQQFQKSNTLQDPQFAYQYGYTGSYSEFNQNQDIGQTQQAYYNNQRIQSFSYQQPLNFQQEQYASQSYEQNVNRTNNQNNFQTPQQFTQLPKLMIPQKSEEDLAEFGNTTCNSASSVDSGRSAPYTLHDDLSIFKVVAAYYGFGFHGKIPWSFWQTYKRATGSTRSNSSLYHHWNGAMKKKYDAFISNGRLSDCILWLETAVMAEQSSNTCLNAQFSNNGGAHGQVDAQQIAHTGTPLFHNRSEPPVSLIALSQPNITQMQPMTLVRTPSVSNEPFPFPH